MTLPDEATQLYRVAPSDFIAARNELSAQLRADGREGDADAVKVLKKPTVVVWALDQLADRDPDGVAALLAAGRELRAAQQATLSTTGGADRLRDATADRREVIARLVKVAVAALEEVGSAGRSQADQISAALESASLDDDAGIRLTTGTLDSVPSAPGGFGDVFGGLTAVEGGGGAAAARSKPAAKSQVAKLQREHDAAVEAERTKRQEAERLGAKIAELRARVDELEVERAEAQAQARANALEAKRAARELAKARR